MLVQAGRSPLTKGHAKIRVREVPVSLCIPSGRRPGTGQCTGANESEGLPGDDDCQLLDGGADQRRRPSGAPAVDARVWDRRDRFALFVSRTVLAEAAGGAAEAARRRLAALERITVLAATDEAAELAAQF